MQHAKNRIKKFLFSSLLIVLIFPLIQSRLSIIRLSPLKGAITLTPDTSLSWEGWISGGGYQQQKEKYLNEAFGLRNFFIRLNNQLAFNLFNKALANGVIIGKQNYLYEENYIKAYYGTDFTGTDSIARRVTRLQSIHKELAAMGKHLLLILAPGKGSFYPEYIPEEYRKEKDSTNYECYSKLISRSGLPVIDFKRYFEHSKQHSPYPLYPQYGIHWSNYGMCMVADSIIKHIERLRGIDMANFRWNHVEMDQPRDGDYDVADGMNILLKLESFPMAYPRLELESDSNKAKPSVLVISDSFYWGMFNFGIARSFGEHHFWYYNNEIFPDHYEKPTHVSDVNLKDELSKYDVIILISTDANLPKLGWGFVESACKALKE